MMVRPRILGAAAALLLGLGCGSQTSTTSETKVAEEAVQDVAAEVAVEGGAGLQSTSGNVDAGEVIASARQSLTSGEVDEAAARLAQLQLQGASFTSTEAKDYRTALSEAYDRAIEASRRGDPRGEAALQLLRAAAPH